MAISSSSWLWIVVVVVAIRSLALEAVFETAVRRRGVLMFSAPLGVRLLFGVAMPGMVYAAGSNMMRSSGQDWWVSIVFTLFAVGIAVFWPAKIYVSQAGIEVRKCLGLIRKSIPWHDVQSVFEDPEENAVKVVSNTGMVISHGKYHVDRSGFLNELRRRKKLA